MQTLVTPHTPNAWARRMARWVLLCFALSLGVAVASPLVNPQAIQLICSGSGAMKLIALADDGTAQVTRHGLDCPLCASTHGGAPPSADALPLAPPRPLALALAAFFSAHITLLTAAPLPARGPP